MLNFYLRAGGDNEARQIPCLLLNMKLTSAPHSSCLGSNTNQNILSTTTEASTHLVKLTIKSPHPRNPRILPIDLRLRAVWPTPLYKDPASRSTFNFQISSFLCTIRNPGPGLLLYDQSPLLVRVFLLDRKSVV